MILKIDFKIKNMKQFRFLLVLVVTLILTSCNFTENIDVQPDGTGKFSLEMDGAGLMAMAGEKLGSEFGSRFRSETGNRQLATGKRVLNSNLHLLYSERPHFATGNWQ